MAEWIWLSEKLYPEFQKTKTCCFAPEQREDSYCMVEFQKCFCMENTIRKLKVKVFGDTSFRLWLNGAFISEGPVAAGGDFLCTRPMPTQYYTVYEVIPNAKKLHFFAQVQLSPVVLSDYSCGHGGFFLEAVAEDDCGQTIIVGSDETWDARVNQAFVRPYLYDGFKEPTPWHKAEKTKRIWNLRNAQIPELQESVVTPVETQEILLNSFEEQTSVFLFDKIYSGYVKLEISDACSVTVECFEREGQQGEQETVIAAGQLQYRGMQLHSIGGYRIRAKNLSTQNVKIKVSLIFTHYRIMEEGSLITSDPDLNRIWDVCAWTLRICRQTLHLDSPKHQEPLACTGDYYIETLMTAFTFGDMRLARLDVIRTADWLKENKGVMFHTSYSLIWVQMLYTVYLFSGDTNLLQETKEALDILMERFFSYMGENGVLEHAPNYMFVDWTVIDGYTMHHPPKALGQTCLNAFYYRALCLAEKICQDLGDDLSAEKYAGRAERLKEAFNRLFYDENEKLYFDGLDTPGEVNADQPENPNSRYFTKYGNTLAVLYGLCEKTRGCSIMERIVNDQSLPDVQPYFMHFVLEALSRTGLFETYGMRLLRRWTDMVSECDKGLKEGWFAPEEGYFFDYSHAWGGTPAYQIPCKILGFEMIKPGFSEISLSPCLYDLEFADVVMPTPYGPLRCSLKRGKAPVIEVPDGILYTVREK